MIVYHGSINIVTEPLIGIGRRNLDFGMGFYITNIKDQVTRWAKQIAFRENKQAYLNVYDLDIEIIQKEFRYKKFDSYDEDWLKFIISNRKGGSDWQKFDLIEGGVANDRVIDTVESYIIGNITLEGALGELSKHQPNNQLCITNQDIIEKHLSFISAELC
ncbi:MAG: DUF3990 domain-containing protein [Bacteroidales bacterium]|nr:DUF3990 domain-containing protein [Bacteroidales bacterium]